MDGRMFRAYIEHVLGPELKPGDVVVLDNLPAHKVSDIGEILKKVSATLRFLPPGLIVVPSDKYEFLRLDQGNPKRQGDGLSLNKIVDSSKTVTTDAWLWWMKFRAPRCLSPHMMRNAGLAY